MQIRNLERGRLFQFVRNGGPEIHEVLDPKDSVYRTVGLFHNASAAGLAIFRGPYTDAKDRAVKPVSDYAAAQVRRDLAEAVRLANEVVAEVIAEERS